MTDVTEIQRERRARSQSSKVGLMVRKSRRDGTFMLVDASRNFVVAAGSQSGFGLGLELELELVDRLATQQGSGVKGGPLRRDSDGNVTVEWRIRRLHSPRVPVPCLEGSFVPDEVEVMHAVQRDLRETFEESLHWVEWRLAKSREPWTAFQPYDGRMAAPEDGS